MSEEETDPALRTLFNQQPELPGEAFSVGVMNRADRLRRMFTLRRIVIALVFAAFAAPLQDAGLAATEVLLISLIDIDNMLLAQLLAPINSVAAALSIALFMLRAVHRRLFS